MTNVYKPLWFEEMQFSKPQSKFMKFLKFNLYAQQYSYQDIVASQITIMIPQLPL